MSTLPAIWNPPQPAKPSDYTPPTLAEQVANDFLFSYANPSTRSNYTQGLKAWFRWCLAQGMDPLTGHNDEGIRRSDVERFLRWSEETNGKARRTVAGRFCAIKGFYRRAMMDGHITVDPCAYVKSPPVERKTTTNDLSKAELSRVIAKAKERSPRDYAIFCILGYNGVRVGELVGIDIEDLGQDRAYHTVKVVRKGGRTDTLTLSQEVETVFHMMKSKFGDRVLSKCERAQHNEVLCKVVAHNICVVIGAVHELGIDADFSRTA